jgi:hypothetical protein
MNRRIAHTAQIAALVLALALVPTALAAKGGGSGGGGGKPPKGGTPTYTGTINNLVLVDPTADGLPHWNHTITFNVTSNAQYYFVRVDCYQNGTLVYEKSNGFYPGWMWGTNYGLNGPGWTGGDGDCTAVLYSQNVDATNQHTLDTKSFHAYA